MLGRYQMRRGARADELPAGIRKDTRHHTRHVLRPESDCVKRFLAGELPWEGFRDAYRTTIWARMADDPAPFDALAELARTGDVWLGCACPTKRQPDVTHCHTWLALELMKQAYPDLEVRFPEP
ncbi:MAG: hypothetical protein AAF211_25160 [Myxococcota bacterium]